MPFVRVLASLAIVAAALALPAGAAQARASDTGADNADCSCKEARKVPVRSMTEPEPIRKKKGERTRRILM